MLIFHGKKEKFKLLPHESYRLSIYPFFNVFDLLVKIGKRIFLR